MIIIKMVVQGQPAAGVTWPATEHLYYIGYEDEGRLGRSLTQAEIRLAEGISATYGLVRSETPPVPEAAPSETPAEAKESGSSGSQPVLEDLINCVSGGVRTWAYRSKCDP
jgi:hypothetical protein